MQRRHYRLGGFTGHNVYMYITTTADLLLLVSVDVVVVVAAAAVLWETRFVLYTRQRTTVVVNCTNENSEIE